MLPFLQTTPSDANSSGCPAGRGLFVNDGRKKSFLVLWRTQARLKSMAFSRSPLATINAEDAATLIRRYRESRPDATCLHSTQFRPRKHRACRCGADCRAAFRIVRGPAAREFLRPCVAESAAKAGRQPMELRLHCLRESKSRSHCRRAF